MRALFIGGTGTISQAITERCVNLGWDLFLLNRGNNNASVPDGATLLKADIHDADAVRQVIDGLHFDVVANFIAFHPDDIKRDIELFEGRTKQYLFISSASAYQKPLSSPIITESTPLANPHWEYSRNKILCEEVLMSAYRETGFPVTIVRPSHTYSPKSIPLALHGDKGSFSVIERIRQGKKVIVHGDGLTLWALTHCQDFAIAFCGLMGNVHAMGDVFHITSDESLTWNQIYECIGNALGVAPKMVHIASETLAPCHGDWEGALIGDKSNTVLFDNQKIKRVVPEFKATIRFDQGVRQCIDYIYSHPECQTPDPDFDAWMDAVIDQYELMQKNLARF